MKNDLLTISQAAELYRIPVAALLRMDSEGLVTTIRIGDESHILASDIERLALFAKDDPGLLTCACAGPCECYHLKGGSTDTYQ
jgi:hypothetical protein